MSSPAPNAYTHALSLVASEMASVDAVIQSRLSSEVTLVEQVAQYIIQGGGKRLRPALLQLCAKAVASHLAGPSGVARPLRPMPPAAFDQMDRAIRAAGMDHVYLLSSRRRANGELAARCVGVGYAWSFRWFLELTSCVCAQGPPW